MQNEECRMKNEGDRGIKADFLQVRTRKFALAVIRLCDSLPKGRTADVIAKQLIRCGSSVGANYRAACRGRSKPDFVSKLGIVLEEIDESVYWLDLLVEANLVTKERGEAAIQEAEEIVAMVVASLKTAKASLKQ
jgi:four helix bundle protein